MVSSLMNVLEELYEISNIVNKSLIVFLLPVYLIILFFIMHFVIACLLFYPSFLHWSCRRSVLAN